ncbi:hypothetical protein PHLCEN_2v11053 [Hermanssonia centrifuga]|uniref:Uncharacterized protein n=1 Tax=Hermanssonia centrifuga TaxID=98765 RepID=A0A2R6NL54_9APHY|nr:hypothetical protein PHLCEN_2v11053 [Hermanssonia centrifuga]
MSSQVPILEISPPKSTIPTCSPNLMPFHISYSGPAPISTYFRVKQTAPPAVSGTPSSEEAPVQARPPSPTSTSMSISDSQTTLVASSSSAGSSMPSMIDISTATQPDDVEMDDADVSESVSGSKHLTAAFRGRTVRGLRVPLPEGYTGLVLSAPEDKKKGVASETKPSAKKAPASKRGTRRATRSAETVDEEDTEHDSEIPPEAAEPSEPVRSLKPTSIFSDFVIWNADIPVDEGRDEYLRSLTEWTRLAAEKLPSVSTILWIELEHRYYEVCKKHRFVMGNIGVCRPSLI